MEELNFEKLKTLAPCTDRNGKLCRLTRFWVDVYKRQGAWGYTYEPSAIPASKIKFFYEDSKLIFAAFHDYGSGNGGGSYSVYEIDENSGIVSGHSYDTLNENDVLNKRALAVELLSGESFDVEASEDSQKDILANSYGKAVNK